jgi:tetratricopeptide (TPR) repeat protein
VAIALDNLGRSSEAEQALQAKIGVDLKSEIWDNLETSLYSVGLLYAYCLAFHQSLRCLGLARHLAAVYAQSKESAYTTLDLLVNVSARQGLWEQAESYLGLRGGSPPMNDRALYRPGDQKSGDAMLMFWRGQDPSATIAHALSEAKFGRSRRTVGSLHRLLGDWSLQQSDWAQARQSYEEVVRMARERNQTDAGAETGLALAKFHLNELPDAQTEAERLAQLCNPAHFYLARLWQALGDIAEAKHHARAAYKKYWADGEPHVFRYWLDRTIELLSELKEPIPQLPPFDASKHPPFPWEVDVLAAIERLKAEKASKSTDNSTPDD